MDASQLPRRLSPGALFLALAIALGCSRNVATGERQFNLLSRQQEIELGSQAAPQFLKGYGGELPDAAVVRYVRSLGHELAAKSERAHLPWEFHVVDSSEVNAFALPGGKVFVSRGLLARLDDEAQLAAVLGHEIGHVTAQHIGQQVSRQMAVGAAATALGAVGEAQDRAWLRVLGVGAQVGGAVYLLHFSREQELEADALGMRYMTRLGYDPAGEVRVLRVLAALEKESGGRPPQILATHPAAKDRVRAAEGRIARQYREPRAYVSAPLRYDRAVLVRLAALPPPRNRGDQTREDAAGAKP